MIAYTAHAFYVHRIEIEKRNLHQEQRLVISPKGGTKREMVALEQV